MSEDGRQAALPFEGRAAAVMGWPAELVAWKDRLTEVRRAMAEARQDMERELAERAGEEAARYRQEALACLQRLEVEVARVCGLPKPAPGPVADVEAAVLFAKADELDGALARVLEEIWGPCERMDEEERRLDAQFELVRTRLELLRARP